MSNQKKFDKIFTYQFVSKNLKQNEDILNFSKKTNANNDDIFAFYNALKAIEEYRSSFNEFSDKRVIFLLHFATKCCAIITLKVLSIHRII